VNSNGDVSNNYVSNDKKIRKMILGLGKTGLSCARYFSSLGVPFSVMDAKSQPGLLSQLRRLDPEVSFSQLEEDTRFSPQEIDELIVSPGIPLSTSSIQQAVSDGIGVNGDVNIFLKQTVVPVVGITGSNGKSTVTALLGEMLENAGFKVGVGGNIGTPCLDLIDLDCDIYVLELSSYQLETIADAKCELATVLNLSPDHLDRYESDTDYYRTKASIYSNANIAVKNADLDFDFSFNDGTELISFSGQRPADSQSYGIRTESEGTFLCQGERRILNCDRISMRGSHNAENALAAIAIAERLGVAEEVIAATLASFTGLPHRCELVAELDGTTFINDSKSTNPGSTIAAIKGFAGTSDSLIVLIGGQTKDANFSALRDALIDNQATVVIYGEDGQVLERSFQGCSTTRVSTLDEALKVAVAASTTASNTDHIVLFSPACASFDQFENFEARGERFRSLVQGMN
tara:strand:- start:2215 stop:3600 length:1386 start_codon:yes stop_codon:yes gene_type:complete